MTGLIMLLRRVKCQFPKREVYLASEHSNKVSTNSVAARITKVLPSLIHEDQTGYIKGRFIGQNIRLIATMIGRIKDSGLSMPDFDIIDKSLKAG